MLECLPDNECQRGEGLSGKGRSFLFRLGNFLNFKCAPVIALMCSGRKGWQREAATRLGARLDWVLVWLAGVSIMKVLPQSAPSFLTHHCMCNNNNKRIMLRGNNTNSAACKFDCSCSRAKKTTRQGSGKEVESKRELVRAAGVGAGIQ